MLMVSDDHEDVVELMVTKIVIYASQYNANYCSVTRNCYDSVTILLHRFFWDYDHNRMFGYLLAEYQFIIANTCTILLDRNLRIDNVDLSFLLIP